MTETPDRSVSGVNPPMDPAESETVPDTVAVARARVTEGPDIDGAAPVPSGIGTVKAAVAVR